MGHYFAETLNCCLQQVPNMSEKSFAVASIAAAIICGTFFYPPPPADHAPGAPRTENALVPQAQKATLGQKVALLKADAPARAGGTPGQ